MGDGTKENPYTREDVLRVRWKRIYRGAYGRKRGKYN